MDAVANFYSRPQVGTGFPIYSGSRRQMGSGLWGTIQRIALPILAKFLPMIGRTVADKTINTVAGAASDALTQRSGFVDALKARGKAQVQDTLSGLVRQTGRGLKRKPARGKVVPKKKKRMARLPW